MLKKIIELIGNAWGALSAAAKRRFARRQVKKMVQVPPQPKAGQPQKLAKNQRPKEEPEEEFEQEAEEEAEEEFEGGPEEDLVEGEEGQEEFEDEEFEEEQPAPRNFKKRK